MKRYFICCAVLLMMRASILWAGGEKQDGSSDSAAGMQQGPVATAPGEFPVYKGGQVTLRTFVNGAGSTVTDWSYEGNVFTKFVTDKTGVKIEWLQENTNPQEKLNLLLASNNLPDMIFTGTLPPEMQIVYGSQGILIPTEDLLKKNMFYFKKVLESDPEILNKYRMSDGKVYCVPKVMGSYEITYEQFCMINKAWLDKLGLAMPTTTEEFKKVLIAFKTRDPNGNGIADEIPMLGYSDGGSPGRVWGFLMFPFQYHDGEYSTLLVKDGNTVFPAFTQEGWRQGLRYLHDLFENGLIDPESFTITDRNQVKKIMMQGDGTVGVIATKGPHHVMDSTYKHFWDYVYVPPLKGPSGVKRHMYNPDIPKIGDTYYSVAITKANKYPDITMRYLDSFYEEAASLSMMYGVKDEDWRYAKSGEMGINGEPAVWTAIRQMMGVDTTRTWHMMGPTWFPWRLRYGETISDPTKTYNGSYTMYKAAKEIYSPWAEEKSHFPQNILFLPDEVEEAVGIKTDIYNYIFQSIAEFATGKRDLDKDWATYLKDLNGYGLDKWMELQLEGYKRQYGGTLTYKK
jgi:putative aldouronate transport system substrate-binding protein